MYVCLQKDAKQCCASTKRDRTRGVGQWIGQSQGLQRPAQWVPSNFAGSRHCLSPFWWQTYIKISKDISTLLGSLYIAALLWCASFALRHLNNVTNARSPKVCQPLSIKTLIVVDSCLWHFGFWARVTSNTECRGGLASYLIPPAIDRENAQYTPTQVETSQAPWARYNSQVSPNAVGIESNFTMAFKSH